ncbi:MAG: bifunctional phosphoribosyl-AMP cyclohydrolase/phosphoribosyl-ATP diphosphatase HisIE [Thermosulfidibacteraceae bacterium]|jgi:phosphoribosyl-ATP pyrophosphohydrolase/phosphoribosyl-AMP cyclohydrolase
MVEIDWEKVELIPAIIQDYRTGKVLMLGYMNRNAFMKTIESGKVHFYSRKRQRLWMKGEESGNELIVKEILVDCDEDTLLVLVEPLGPTCHTGNVSCFYRKIDGNPAEPIIFEILADLYEIIENRKKLDPSISYTASLFNKGIDKISKKLMEEAAETIIAGKNDNKEEVIYESADLIYHLLVFLAYFGIKPYEIYKELKNRFSKSGLRMKNERKEN